MQPSTSIDSSVEAASRAEGALEAAASAGCDALVAKSPPTVRWLLCGRGRPVDAAAPVAAYIVVLHARARYVLFPDIEAPRVAAEERFQELGYEPVPFPWFAGPEAALAELLDGSEAVGDGDAEAALAPLRRNLSEDDRERYRAAGRDAGDAMVEALDALTPELSEQDAAAELAYRCRRRGLFPGVLLVAGEERQPVHRHPLPTGAPLGRHCLLAVTVERDGLYSSLTRLASFGPAPARLAELLRLTAEIDAAVLRASRPGRTLGEVFDDLAAAYAERGFPEEWRRHHQGGLTGYKGRETFAVPGEPTPVPPSAAFAWNPSITGGAKSEDTAIVTDDGLELVTRTPALPELHLDGVPRPTIVEL